MVTRRNLLIRLSAGLRELMLVETADRLGEMRVTAGGAARHQRPGGELGLQVAPALLAEGAGQGRGWGVRRGGGGP